MALGDRIKAARKNKGLTQTELARLTHFKISTINNYERGVSNPDPEGLRTLSKTLGVTSDYLLELTADTQPQQGQGSDMTSKTSSDDDFEYSEPVELDERAFGKFSKDFVSGKNLRVLPVKVVTEGKGDENITLVTPRAATVYSEHFFEPQYIGKLPSFNLPLPEFRNGIFRVFPVIGESMAPELLPGSYVIGRYVENWLEDIRDGMVHIIIYQGENRPVIKRLKNRIKDYGKLILQSDNIGYSTYGVDYREVKEVWEYVAHIKFSVHRTAHQIAVDVNELKNELALIREGVARNKKVKSQRE